MENEVLKQKEISAWLDSDKKTFESGMLLFSKYSRNPSMAHNLTRKNDMERLTYQLRRIIGTHLDPDPVVEKEVLPVKGGKKADKKAGKKADKKAGKKADKITSDTGNSDTISEDQKAEKLTKIDPELLPEDIRKIYNDVAEAYKVQRTFHEKMKLADTDENRAILRAEVTTADDIIAKGWDVIDTYLAGADTAGSKTEPTPLEISNDINACRAYISRSINDIAKLNEKQKNKRIDEVKLRISRLIELKAPVKIKTRTSLVQLGIIDEKSDLVGE